MTTALSLLQDKYIFALFQIVIVIALAIGLGGYRLFLRKGGIPTTVIRGDESWSQLALSYGVASVVTLQIINVSAAFDGYKVIISLFDLAVLLYLCFFNSWFRNWILLRVHKSKSKEETI